MPSRVRETVTGAFNVTNVRRNYTRNSCAAAWIGGSSSISMSGSVRTKRIEDCTTPGFFSIIRKGGILPNNGALISDITETRVPCGLATHSSSFTGGCYRVKSEGPAWSYLLPLVQWPADYDMDKVNLVSQQSQAKARAAIFDALTTLAEMPQTSRLLGNAWGRVNNFAMRSASFARRFRSPGSAVRAFNEKWLEYRYGWLPAIYAAEDALKAYNESQNERKFISEKATMAENINLNDTKTTITPLIVGGVGTQVLTQTDVVTGTRRYTGAAWGPATGSVRKYAGFDPILTAWELVPYSFVADWFLNVGTWVNSWSPFSPVDLKGGSCSVTDDYEEHQTWEISYTGGHQGQTGLIETIRSVQLYSRFGITPGLAPVWNPRITPARVLDLFALVLSGKSAVRALIRK